MWDVYRAAQLDVTARRSARRSKAPTFVEAAERWRSSRRVDVADSTRVLYRVALGRVLPILGARHIDELKPPTWPTLSPGCTQTATSARRSPKSVTALAQTLDHAGVRPNPARDKIHVRCRARNARAEPPTAERPRRGRLPDDPGRHRLALLWFDWSGARVALSTPLGRRLRRAAPARAATRPGKRRHARRSGSSCTTTSPRRSRRPSARARIATPPRGCSPTPARTRSAPRSRRRARRSRSRSFSRTTYGTGASRCCTGRAIWAEIGALRRPALLACDERRLTHVLLDDREVDYRRLLASSA